jgi:plastocyanin
VAELLYGGERSVSRNWKVLFAAVALAALMAFALVACDDNDDDDDDTGSDTPTSAAGETPTGEPSEGGDNALELSADTVGETLEIAVGDTVTFTNGYDEPATVSINGTDESGDIEPGGTYEHTFDEAGEFEITSAHQEDFTATIAVS